MSGDDSDEELAVLHTRLERPARAAGEMGVSSERVGPTGPGPARRPTGCATSPSTSATPDDETRPEQSAGGPEDNPDGLAPKAGYSSKDPRSD